MAARRACRSVSSFAELLDYFADLPVGGMDDSHDVIPFRRTLTPLSLINQRFRRRCG
ncbi:hypothetical protein ABIF38_008812 [Bradyrhizobium japonicum]|jgi:hypothetical protein|nr:hypothetical protein [Bradyrhizobium elkanii]MCS3452332.1 hypothetical protein [Bradyrhizobium elkanii]MCS3565565.1 hypothetical protein [Bradyrhizobium elkanii]MCS3572995.1 hypothetical protein [Bradyrhizobium elkanii]MCS3594312.1 hypothetical protein [Bradyrhizobium elkanii]